MDQIRLGKNAEDNWKLFREAKQTDYWLHLDKFPSGHAFIESDDQELINRAASLVKEHSKVKKLNRIKVVYCRKSNLKLGTSVGEVIIKSHKKCKYIFV